MRESLKMGAKMVMDCYFLIISRNFKVNSWMIIYMEQVHFMKMIYLLLEFGKIIVLLHKFDQFLKINNKFNKLIVYFE